ncbi:hypothetical protein [Kaistia sp. MMO-174]|uniref:hypothetical protein n=1 Tax=Kaistia sp. MMO-174 TaxID=3081256 RepID=UPI0030181236
MGKVEIKIPHVTWRAGRPRFIPGRHLRALGYQGRDLKQPDGRWFSLDEAIAWSKDFEIEIASRRQAKADGKRLARPKRPTAMTVGHVIDHLFRLGEMQPIDDRRERERKGALAPKTIRWYRSMADVLAAYDPELWASPAAAVSRIVAKGLYRRLAADKGLAMARGIIAVCSRAYGEYEATIPLNPFLKLKMKATPPRLRAGEIEEMETLIAAADALGLPEIGDAILMGLVTGQRQNDRLRLVERARIDGSIVFRQSKTGAVVTVPALPQLDVRLQAARLRRAARKVTFPEVLIDEQKWRPWPDDEGDAYRKQFTKVRAAAVAGVLNAEGTAAAALEGRNEPLWTVEPCPSLEGFHDQDLRDTAVTWLARAGCTIPEIVSITGHTEESATTIMKHYLGRHPEMAKSGMEKMRVWLDAKGTKF